MREPLRLDRQTKPESIRGLAQFFHRAIERRAILEIVAMQEGAEWSEYRSVVPLVDFVPYDGKGAACLVLCGPQAHEAIINYGATGYIRNEEGTFELKNG